MTTRAVQTYWWNEEPNFGDGLNAELIRRLFCVDVVWASLTQAELVAAGSVIQWITPVASRRTDPIHVWGSGYIFGDEPSPPAESVTYHAVRGRHSMKMSGLSDEIALGDPALLVGLVYEKPKKPKWQFGLVPHLWHRTHPAVAAFAAVHGGRVIDVAGDPNTVINEIACCDYILSTSLHGLVVADSFGIPNHWATLEPGLFGGRWKFDDYYSAFGLEVEPLALAGAAALDLSRPERERYERPDLSQLQLRLLSAFPFQSR